MRYGFVIPVYNHGSTLEAVVQKLAVHNLPIIVIDDGNDEYNKAFIKLVAEKYQLVDVVVHKKNCGKGKAVASGIFRANEIGLTHVFQIDSDGQHDTDRVKKFIEKSKENPDAVICGYPEYDKDAPKHRVNGRKIANGWVHFVCLSNEIKDAMIGFRVYPVAPYLKLLKSHTFIDSRMGCDIDVLVRLSWLGIRIISESVKVSYPADGISNFRMVSDNLRIAWTYTRLCLGMFIRFPIIIYRNLKKNK